MAPILTHLRMPLYPRALSASATGASPVKLLHGAMPVNTSATEIYSTAQITSVMMMPKGKSRCGFLHSSAAVETESNPIYVKKTMAEPVSTPEKPLGRKGCQLAV